MAFTHDVRANRLSGLAVYGHNPAIRAVPSITESIHQQTYLAIMQQKTGHKTIHGIRANKMLEGKLTEEVKMKPRKINYKKPAQWRKSGR